MLGLNEVERRENEVGSPADIRALRQLRTRLTEMEKEVVRQHERKLQVGICDVAASQLGSRWLWPGWRRASALHGSAHAALFWERGVGLGLM